MPWGWAGQEKLSKIWALGRNLNEAGVQRWESQAISTRSRRMRVGGVGLNGFGTEPGLSCYNSPRAPGPEPGAGGSNPRAGSTNR